MRKLAARKPILIILISTSWSEVCPFQFGSCHDSCSLFYLTYYYSIGYHNSVIGLKRSQQNAGIQLLNLNIRQRRFAPLLGGMDRIQWSISPEYAIGYYDVPQEAPGQITDWLGTTYKCVK